MVRILITGPQGSGKSTQSEIIAKKLNVGLINTGEMIRDLAEKDTDESRSLREDMDKGILVDDRVTSRLVKEKVENDFQNGFVVDGYPRSLEQLQLFDPDYTLVFYLDISDEEAVRRLVNRGREDDTPEGITERLKVYHELTEPVLDHYQTTGKLIRLDGSQTIEAIVAEIEKLVEERS